MKHAARIARLIAGSLMALALIAGWAASASAQESGSITITTYACEGDDCSAPAVSVSLAQTEKRPSAMPAAAGG